MIRTDVYVIPHETGTFLNDAIRIRIDILLSSLYQFFYELLISFQYLDWRFNKAVRVLASTCFIIQMVLYMAIVVYAPALALSQSILLHILQRLERGIQ